MLANLKTGFMRALLGMLISMSLTGCAYIRNIQMPAIYPSTSTPTFIPQPSATFTPKPTTTSTPTNTPTTPVYNIEGMLFEDANRNGLREAGEKPITGVEICVYARGCVPVDEEGRFKIVYDKEIAPINIRQPKLEDGTVKYNLRMINGGQKIIPAFENIPEQKLDVVNREPVTYGIKARTGSKNELALIQDKEIMGICPVYMSTPGVYFAFPFNWPNGRDKHQGIDIGGRRGTLHMAPENGSIIMLGFDGGGGLSINYKISENKYLLMTHLDFSYNDYATLRFFGLDPFLMYDSNGKMRPILTKRWPATKNTEIFRGQILPLYMSDTGRGKGFVHTHIGIYISNDPNTPVDPCLYLDCCGK